ncbi:MAG: prohibitin family protein [Candidatus Moranbacteria bacterium]|nr:prohibitin family protein [Candidatus Moranbacteria bacterium]
MNLQSDKVRKYFWIILAILFLLSLKNGIIFLIILFAVFFLVKKFNLNKNDMSTYNNFDFSKLGESIKKGTSLVVAIVILIILLPLMIVVIDAGETGVYSLFGKVRDQELSSGLHFKNPLAKITKITIRTQEYTMSGTAEEGKKQGVDSIGALTKEGLDVALDITVLYRLDEKEASDVYKEVGLNYEEKIIRPIIQSSIREIVAQYEAKVIYSEKRTEIGQKIFENLESSLTGRGIVLEDLLLRNVVLPADLQGSIEQKLQAEQEAQKMEFVLEKERKEKERKIIEAEGQRESQEIINQSLTPSYLNYLYIKNLQEREGTIYVPIGDNGIPLFRGI